MVTQNDLGISEYLYVVLILYDLLAAVFTNLLHVIKIKLGINKFVCNIKFLKKVVNGVCENDPDNYFCFLLNI